MGEIPDTQRNGGVWGKGKQRDIHRLRKIPSIIIAKSSHDCRFSETTNVILKGVEGSKRIEDVFLA